MKILMVAPPSLHFFRWTDQLKEAGHAVYWFDALDGGAQIPRIGWVKQTVGWKLKYNYPGRYWIKNRLPKVYNWIQKWNEHDLAKVFEQKLQEIQPDVVHSFALHISCAPILKVMKKHKSIQWVYSSWGSDLFLFQNDSSYLKDIKKVLPHIDYLFTDCKRDYEIAKKHGFVGEFLGVFPGGGGFPLDEMAAYSLPINQRKILLIKGFQGRSGRAIPVLKALEKMKESLKEYEIVVFGADNEVIAYGTKSVLSQWNNFKIYGKLQHNEIFKWMGKSLIYIGNSNSDGIPNTLLEALCMEVFPIQSNPGGVTEEVITHGINGYLIENPLDSIEIAKWIENAIMNPNLRATAQKHNVNLVNENYNRNLLKTEVIKLYESIF